MSDENMDLFPDIDNVDVDELVDDIPEDKPVYKQLVPDIYAEFEVVSVDRFVDGENTKKPGGWGAVLGISPVGADGEILNFTTNERLYSLAKNPNYPDWEPTQAWKSPLKNFCNMLDASRFPLFPRKVKGSDPVEYMKQDGSEETIGKEEFPSVKRALTRGQQQCLIDIIRGEEVVLGTRFFAPTRARGKYVNINLYEVSRTADPELDVERVNLTQAQGETADE